MYDLIKGYKGWSFFCMVNDWYVLDIDIYKGVGVMKGIIMKVLLFLVVLFVVVLSCSG